MFDSNYFVILMFVALYLESSFLQEIAATVVIAAQIVAIRVRTEAVAAMQASAAGVRPVTVVHVSPQNQQDRSPRTETSMRSLLTDYLYYLHFDR